MEIIEEIIDLESDDDSEIESEQMMLEYVDGGHRDDNSLIAVKIC